MFAGFDYGSNCAIGAGDNEQQVSLYRLSKANIFTINPLYSSQCVGKRFCRKTPCWQLIGVTTLKLSVEALLNTILALNPI